MCSTTYTTLTLGIYMVQQGGITGWTIGDMGLVSVPPDLWNLLADLYFCMPALQHPLNRLAHVLKCDRSCILCTAKGWFGMPRTCQMPAFLLNSKVLKNAPSLLTCRHSIVLIQQKLGTSNCDHWSGFHTFCTLWVRVCVREKLILGTGASSSWRLCSKLLE